MVAENLPLWRILEAPCAASRNMVAEVFLPQGRALAAMTGREDPIFPTMPGPTAGAAAGVGRRLDVCRRLDNELSGEEAP